MSRLLLCCFAESTGCLSSESIASLVTTYTDEAGVDCADFFNNIFKAMGTKDRTGFSFIFKKINCIDERIILPPFQSLIISKEARSTIIDLLKLNWKDTTPEILGALIQSIVMPNTSSICGNYTATANIQKLIGPLFLTDLYDAFDKANDNIEELTRLYYQIQTIVIFDPSCGAGNFLLVAYKEINKLTSLICSRLCELGDSSTKQPYVSTQNFYGLEERKFSCNVAKLGFLFSVYQQTGVLEDAFTAYYSTNIKNCDPLKEDWRSFCCGGETTYIIGNPTYRGANRQTPQQKENLAKVFSSYKNCKNLDYASCWFILAAKYLRNQNGSFAFVTTNSLTQGNQVQMLWPKLYDLGYYIQFAHTSFKWKNDARNKTAVTVVIIGMRHIDDYSGKCELHLEYTTRDLPAISPYLVPGKAIIEEKSVSISGLPDMVKGNMPYDSGYLLLSSDEKNLLCKSSPEAQQYIRHVIGSDEFINGKERWCLWIHDDEVEHAMTVPGIKERVEAVRESRINNTDNAVKKMANRSHQFRDVKETHTQSLVIPAVYSENYLYTPIGFVFSDTIVTNLASVIYDCEPWLFGIIASKMHNVWVRTVCGKLEERIRYSLKLGYNTFPLPPISAERKKVINKCVLNIIRIREEHSDLTLAQLYHKDKMPDDLKIAHSMLDEVVDKCYRDDPFLSADERLSVLFGLYEQLED